MHEVPGTTGIADAAARLREQRVDCLLVAGDPGPGIVTRTDLLDALALRGLPRDFPVGPLASRPLLSVRADAVLFQALVSMTEHHVERVVVVDAEGAALGTLGMAEVLAHYASSSHLISMRPAVQALGHDAIGLKYLAEATLSKGNPLTWLGQVREHGGRADLRRGGVFPLVHGLRVLALKHGIAHRNSFDRCAALVSAGALDRELGRDVPQALAVLMRLRLGQQLADLDAGQPASNGVDVAALRRLDRELLRDALRVVNAFKDHVADVFHLGG